MNNEKEKILIDDTAPWLYFLPPEISFREMQRARIISGISKFSSEQFVISYISIRVSGSYPPSPFDDFPPTIDFGLYSRPFPPPSRVFTSGLDYLKFRGGRLIGAWRGRPFNRDSFLNI